MLKRLIAGNELAELERWQVQWEEHRRWFAEFPSAAIALDHMKAEVDGMAVKSIRDVRDSLRSDYVNKETLIQVVCALEAAISLLERGGKTAAPSDRMFGQMLEDYKLALSHGVDELRNMNE